MISGPRQRAIYRHLVETFEEDLDAELQSILQSAKADFVVICLWKTDDPRGFELSCAPSGVETIERLGGVDVRFEWESEAEYLELVVARLARNVLGNRDVGGVQVVRMHDRHFGGRTDLTEFVADLLQHEAMEVAGERGFPGAGEDTGPVYRIEGEVWHPKRRAGAAAGAPAPGRRVARGRAARLRRRRVPRGVHPAGEPAPAGDDAGGRDVAGGPAHGGPLAPPAPTRRRRRSRPASPPTSPPGSRARRGQEWLRVELDDGSAGFVLASSLSEGEPGQSGGRAPAARGRRSRRRRPPSPEGTVRRGRQRRARRRRPRSRAVSGCRTG